MNLPKLERPFSALRCRLLTAACVLVACSFSAAQASIIQSPGYDPADIERILADSSSSGAHSASPPSKSERRSQSDSDKDPLLLAQTLARSDGNMTSSSSSSAGGASSAPAALPGAAVSLARSSLSSRLATEASAFLPDPPLDGTLRPPQAPAGL